MSRARKTTGSLFWLLLCCYFVAFSGLSNANQPALRQGDEGPQIRDLQYDLFLLGELHPHPTGVFDADTTAAVRAFQEKHHLAADGIVGEHTWSKLRDVRDTVRVYEVQPGDTLWDVGEKYQVPVERLIIANNISDPAHIRVGETLLVPLATVVDPELDVQKVVLPVMATVSPAAVPRPVPLSFPPGTQRNRPVELTPWNEASKVFPHGSVAKVIDVRTGLEFQVRRYYGHYHADVEPLTAADTETMKRLYGEWSWERRPIVVEVAGKSMAASMNGMPHGDSIINSNGYQGHFCIHFLNSRIHRTGDLDPAHQEAVRAAAGYRSGSLSAR